MKTLSFESYKKAVTFFKLKDAKTCAHCLKLFSSSEKRENHERNIHEDVDGIFKCVKCTKTYTNEDAFN